MSDKTKIREGSDSDSPALVASGEEKNESYHHLACDVKKLLKTRKSIHKTQKKAIDLLVQCLESWMGSILDRVLVEMKSSTKHLLLVTDIDRSVREFNGVIEGSELAMRKVSEFRIIVDGELGSKQKFSTIARQLQPEGVRYPKVDHIVREYIAKHNFKRCDSSVVLYMSTLIDHVLGLVVDKCEEYVESTGASTLTVRMVEVALSKTVLASELSLILKGV